MKRDHEMHREAPVAATLRAAIALARSVRLISRVTPRNAEAEGVRLKKAFARGDACLPRWDYGMEHVAGADDTLGELLGLVRSFDEPLRSVVRDRLLELRLEVAMVATVGGVAFGALAAERHRQTVRETRAADAMAADWANAEKVTEKRKRPPSRQAAKREEGAEEQIPSDSQDSRSLLARVRALVGEHRAPFAVVVVRGLQALAATGERTVYVAEGRAVSERTAERVAIHEVMGHVLPRVHAESAHPIFTLGTARGNDDQEGLALVHEERHGLLDPARRAELAERHIAASVMRAGADFVEVVRHLQRDVSLEHALHTAARVFRGSTGTFPGLGRESVYIPSFRRVSSRLGKDPHAEELLSCGQVAVSALAALAQLGKQASPCPPPMTETV